ncbi:unnamed protein product [Urochloa humidicola]
MSHAGLIPFPSHRRATDGVTVQSSPGQDAELLPASGKVELPQANKLLREEGRAVECSAGLPCLPSRTQMSGAQPAPRRRMVICSMECP